MTKLSKRYGWRILKLSARILLLVAAGRLPLPETSAQGTPGGQVGWDQQAAAQYLDARIDLWFERATDLKTGPAKTTCISCHTVVPYLLARPVLRKAMHVNEPTVQEVKLLKEIALRVETYPEHESMSDAKHGGERATEAVLNALVLARQDAFEKPPHLSAVAQKAFQQLWETQSADGAWDWMNFGEEPDETADARYNGAALAAIAIGTAPGLLESQDLVGYVDKLRSYLNGKFGEQNVYRRTWMLLASSRLDGLLTRDQRELLMAELRSCQNSDGGWSLYRLGPWRWSGASAPSTSTLPT
jgi:squalene-hopene/tetraprenyl-beta-curcumene cyclase